jgi:hypothetical protein
MKLLLVFVSSLITVTTAYQHVVGDIAASQAFLKSDDRAATSDTGQSSDVFPVPTASRCIVIMMCQYMIIYLALAVCRTYHEFAGIATTKVFEAFKAAQQTLTYGPMLCVLFIACRMRVEFLSAGRDQPQIWVQKCMYAVTYAVLGSTLLVFIIPLITGKHLPLKDGVPDQIAEDDKSKSFLLTLTVLRYVILTCLYVGLAGIIVGISIYLPPGATELLKLPPPAPAVHCTMILAIAFFSIQLVIAFCRTYEEFQGHSLPRVVAIMQDAATTVEFGPMLAVLFLCARMRALQHDSQPQLWAQECMYVATVSMITTTLLAVIIPFTAGGGVETDAQTNEKRIKPAEGASKSLVYTLTAVRFLCMLGFYGGAVGVIRSIYTFEAPGGPQATLPVSPTAHCVANLSVQFFFVYGMMTVLLVAGEITGEDIHKWKFFSAVEATKATLQLAPMLAILFVTTRMYALLITQKRGAPQAWVQDGMYFCTWSLLISFVFCLATGIVTKVETDPDGNVINKFDNQIAAVLMTIVRYLAIVLLYGGICCVIVGLFIMTPETANGRGAVPVVTDAADATGFGGPPPSAGGIAGSFFIPAAA